jgi:hypothetical protein
LGQNKYHGALHLNFRKQNTLLSKKMKAGCFVFQIKIKSVGFSDMPGSDSISKPP